MCAPYGVCLLVRVQVVSGLGISCTVISRLMMSRAWLKSTQVTGMQLSAIKRLTLGAVGTVLLFFCTAAIAGCTLALAIRAARGQPCAT